jgi:hypothetical protein
MEIVAELQGSLNPEAGGDVALELARIYDYIQRRMIEAAADSKALAQLEETRVLLSNLYQGWQQCEPPAAAHGDQPQNSTPQETMPPEAAPDSGDALLVEELSGSGEYSIVGDSRVWTL